MISQGPHSVLGLSSAHALRKELVEKMRAMLVEQDDRRWAQDFLLRLEAPAAEGCGAVLRGPDMCARD